MDKQFNENELIREYASIYGTTIKEAAAICESVHALYKKLLYIDKADITINKLWSMKQVTTKQKRVKHPRTGEFTTTQSRQVIKFKQSNSPF